MPSLKDVKVKITGVGKTKQITKAMNMVSSSKLRGAQSRIERFRPYAEKFRTVLGDLADKTDNAAHPLLTPHVTKNNSLIVLITSDRGLCGSFNVTLISKALQLAKAKRAEGKEVSFICIGKKGRDAVNKTDFVLKDSFTDQFANLDFNLASLIGRNIISDYSLANIDEVTLIYGEFKNLAKQEVVSLPLLPMQNIKEMFEEIEKEVKEIPGSEKQYIYEPQVKTLLGELLPRFINIQIYRALLDSNASEHAARMTAMDNATRNCNDMISTLTLLYNKTRQASITSDLMDIVGGAEALTG